jgi:hypothetical protein
LTADYGFKRQATIGEQERWALNAMVGLIRIAVMAR